MGTSLSRGADKLAYIFLVRQLSKEVSYFLWSEGELFECMNWWLNYSIRIYHYLCDGNSLDGDNCCFHHDEHPDFITPADQKFYTQIESEKALPSHRLRISLFQIKTSPTGLANCNRTTNSNIQIYTQIESESALPPHRLRNSLIQINRLSKLQSDHWILKF